MTRLTRIVDVTAALAVAGAIGGAVSGVVIVALLGAFKGISIFGLFSLDAAITLTAAAGAGALIGLFVAPLFAWGVLRRVPLGKALLLTTIGTVIGAVLGEAFWPFNPYLRGIPGVLLGGFAGFVLGGIVARLVSGRRLPSAPERVEGP